MKSSLKNHLLKLFALLISSSLVLILISQVSLSTISSYLSNLSMPALIIFTCISFSGLILRTYRFKMFLRQDNDKEAISFLNLVIALSVRNAIMEVLPFRLGEASTIGYLSIYKIKVIESTRALLACIFLDIISLAIFLALALLGLAFLQDTQGNSKSFLSIVTLCLSGILTISFFSYLVVHNIKKIGDILGNTFSSHINKFSHLIPNSLKHFRPFRGTKTILVLLKKTGKKEWMKGLALSLIIRMLKYFSLSILFIDTIGNHSRFWDAKLYHTLLLPMCFIVSEAVASLPASGFLGFGAYELSFEFCYSLLFHKIPNLTSIIFSVHLITQIVNIVALLVVLLIAGSLKFQTKLLQTKKQ
jgi:uncharacterized membrane protein YbhN (UPF0104 family)